jgi:hypothetical protein
MSIKYPVKVCQTNIKDDRGDRLPEYPKLYQITDCNGIILAESYIEDFSNAIANALNAMNEFPEMTLKYGMVDEELEYSYLQMTIDWYKEYVLKV